jgi:hypothetical protein
MTNHIRPYKKWYVLGFVLLLCANLLDRRIGRFTVLPISNAANLTNARFRGKFETLIKFFLPDVPCLKAGELCIELRMFTIICGIGPEEFGTSRAGL